MDHIAIDLGGKHSQICVRRPDGSIKQETRCPTGTLAEYFKTLKQPCRIIVETCAEAFGVADAALETGHEVRVVPATLVGCMGVGARGVKTDKRDARVLSEVSTRIDLPSVHIPSPLSRHWKSSCTARESLVSSRTQLVNSVRGWARTQALKIRSGAPEAFPKRVRNAAIYSPDGLPEYIERSLAIIDGLNLQIAAADFDLKLIAKENTNCQRLMSIPGVGPVTAIRFVAAIDQVKRFPNSHSVQSYLGLVPGEDSSSQRKRRTAITKAGPPRVRWVLGQAAWVFRQVCRRRNPRDPLAIWANELEKRRGKKIAMTALARRLAGIMYALWRDGTHYQPSKLLART
jgi:transposase